MAKVHIPKSEEIIKKEQIKNKVSELKNKKNVSNDELKELLLLILDKLS